MTEDINFLSHFIKEEIYLIKEREVEVINESETTGVIEPQEENVAIQPPQFEGNNKNHISILVPQIQNEESIFLEKILAAVKLTLNECALVSLSNNKELTSLTELSPECIISFGVEGNQIPLPGSYYDIISQNSVKILKADSLSIISADTSKKKQLWEALQKLFLK